MKTILAVLALALIACSSPTEPEQDPPAVETMVRCDVSFAGDSIIGRDSAIVCKPR